MRRSQFVGSLAAGALLKTVGAAASAAEPQIFYERLASAPFPHASRAGGHDYQKVHYDAAGHYSDPTTAIVVPAGFRAPASGIDFIVHFHGWRNNVANVLKRYRLAEQLTLSSRNAVLLVPQGPKDAPDSGDGKLELDEGGFTRFVDEAAARLQTHGIVESANVNRIVLTAHSGGYGGAGGALAHGGANARITDVILFDAAYGYFDAFAAWAKADPSHHFLSLFTDDTSTGNTQLMGMLQGPNPNLFVRLAETMSLAQLGTRSPTFVLTTTVEHDELLQRFNWFALFLQSTALAAIARA